MYKNKVKHSNDGTTSIFIESKNKLFPGTHEAIIDTEDFHKHEALFKRRSLWLSMNNRDKYPYARMNIRHPGGGWYESPSGKKRRRIQKLSLHHLILGKPPKGKEIDHKNYNGLDNRKENIHFVTHSQNKANCRAQNNGTSDYKGVGWRRDRRTWRVRITCKGILYPLGHFTCEHEGALVYNEKARELFGEHAFLNEVPEEYKNDVEVI